MHVAFPRNAQLIRKRQQSRTVPSKFIHNERKLFSNETIVGTVTNGGVPLAESARFL